MSLKPFLAILRTPGVARLVLVGMLAKLPHAAIGIVLTMHVVGTLHRSYFEAGLLTMANTVGMFFGAPWRGRTVDRKGLRRALLPSVVVEAMVWSAAPFVSYQVLIALGFVSGLFMTPVFSLVRQALSVLVPPERQHTAFSLDAIATELMFMFGPMIGVLLANQLHTRVALVVVGASIVIAGCVFIWTNPPTRSTQVQRPARAVESETPSDAVGWPAGEARDGMATESTEAGAPAGGTRSEAPTGEPRDAVPAATRDAGAGGKGGFMSMSLVAILGACGAVSLVLSGTDLSVVAALREWDATAYLGIVMGVWAFGSMIGAVLYGAADRQWHPLWLVLALSVLTVPIGFTRTVPTIAVSVFVAGMLCAPSLASMNAAIVKLVPENRRGEAMGWNGSASTIGSTLGAPVIGAMIDSFGSGAGFWTAGGVGVALTLAGLALYRRRAGGADLSAGGTGGHRESSERIGRGRRRSAERP